MKNNVPVKKSGQFFDKSKHFFDKSKQAVSEAVFTFGKTKCLKKWLMSTFEE